MVGSTFFLVNVPSADLDITRYCERFDFEEALEKDNLLTITLKFASVFEADADWLTKGTILRFNFGFIAGLQSGFRFAKIAEIDYDYGETVQVTLQAMCAGHFLKSVQSAKVWRDVTLAQIAETLADKYQLELDTVATDKIYNNLPQGNRTDFDFLKSICTRENLFL